jgi:hypothetical protein
MVMEMAMMTPRIGYIGFFFIRDSFRGESASPKGEHYDDLAGDGSDLSLVFVSPRKWRQDRRFGDRMIYARAFG